MKKKPFFWIILVVAVALITMVAVWGKQYYDNRYVGSDYYAMVPLDYDMTPVAMRNKDGKETGDYGINYTLTAYNEQGESKTVSFTVYNPESAYSRGEIQPQPGTYLWISASKQIVVRWKATIESDVPENVLKLIKENP